jgi:hypothetical protein
MKIGIVEIMPQGHYTLVHSICNIFSSQEDNEIYIFTHAHGAKLLQPVKRGNEKRITIITQQHESLELFLDTIKLYRLDRIYVTTLEKYYKTFNSTNFGCPVHLFIHNLDEWVQVTYGYRIYHLINEFSLSLQYAYTLKRMILYPRWRKKILKTILDNNGKVVVLNSILKKELMQYIDKVKIEVIPFSVYDQCIADNSAGNQKIRICIPGILSTARRNYDAVFNILERNIELFKGTVELDLLGGVNSAKYGNNIINAAEKLIAKGMVIYYTKTPFISIEDYDKRLACADIILGNLKIKIDKYSSYGKTKETGVIFVMIHAAKPGLIIAGYPIPEELQSSTIVFSSYNELAEIMKTLVEDRNKIQCNMSLCAFIIHYNNVYTIIFLDRLFENFFYILIL